jgi:hypothetical protein
MRVKACTDTVAWRVVEGEAVLVHAETSAYFGLNRTGTALWVALAGGARTAEELVDVLAAVSGEGVREARQDVDAFLQSLLAAGLAAPSENGSTPAPSDAATPPLAGHYEAPALSPFGELEQLILSGE